MENADQGDTEQGLPSFSPPPCCALQLAPVFVAGLLLGFQEVSFLQVREPPPFCLWCLHPESNKRSLLRENMRAALPESTPAFKPTRCFQEAPQPPLYFCAWLCILWGMLLLSITVLFASYGYNLLGGGGGQGRISEILGRVHFLAIISNLLPFC